MFESALQNGIRILRGVTAALLAVAFITDVAQAQSDNGDVSMQLAHSGSSHRPLFGISFERDGVRGVAVGDRGTVMLTNDGGSSWSTEDAETEMALLDVAVGDDRMIAVGQMGLVLVRVGGGEWEERYVDTHERLLSVALHDDGLAVAVGGFGTMRISVDGGSTWTTPDMDFSSFVDEGYDPHLYAVEITEAGRIMVAGEFGLIVVSDDRGDSWRLVRQGDESLSAFHVRPDGVGFAVGQNGIVLRTVDAGENWERVDPDLGGNLLGVSSTPDGLVAVPGMRNMLVSRDDGLTFFAMSDADVNSNWYQQAASGGSGTFVVGHAGRILRLSLR